MGRDADGTRGFISTCKTWSRGKGGGKTPQERGREREEKREGEGGREREREEERERERERGREGEREGERWQAGAVVHSSPAPRGSICQHEKVTCLMVKTIPSKMCA